MALHLTKMVFSVGIFACAIALCLPLSACSNAEESTSSESSEQRDVEALREMAWTEETASNTLEQEMSTTSEAQQSPSATQTADPAKVREEVDAVEARITQGDTTAKVCYLTFDDGPSENTLEILRILKEKGVLATFFVQGNSGKIDLVKNIAEEGHTLGLHTHSHDYARLYANDDAYFADLNAVHDAVSSRVGHTIDIIRFPGGASNAVSANYNKGIMSRLTQSVGAQGYQYFDWNLSGGDSSSPPPPAIDIQNNVLWNVGGMQRACVLMHDTTIKKTTVEALPAVIDGLREKGFVFGTLTHDTPPFHHGVSN